MGILLKIGLPRAIAALGCLLAELLCLRPLFECEAPAPPPRNAPVCGRSSHCAAEAFQLLTLVEVLGSPQEYARVPTGTAAMEAHDQTIRSFSLLQRDSIAGRK